MVPGKTMGQEDSLAVNSIFLSDDGQVMDLTGNQLPDLSSVPLPPTLTELDLAANRLSCIDPQFLLLARLQKLSLRQNLITDTAASELCQLPPLTSLAELVLRDNQLMQIPPVSLLCNLNILDLSYNEIKSLAGLSSVHSGLTELYVTNNQLAKIEELSHLSQLNLLELGSNKIRVMEGLEGLSKLSELWLGRNKIREVALCGLASLTKISIQSNRLTSMHGFQACRLLQELYLSHNGISVIEGLESLTNLCILDLAANRISAIQNLDTLTRLEDLWLNDNSIPSLEGIEEALVGPRQSLTTLYLERNPCTSNPRYVYILRDMLPKIQEIDSVSF